ncbi:MAG: hypothetical protein E6Q62_05985 [Nitrosomonas sp.]|nr:MAG: hypothetical protein E6Q62_05985 [Nitrosomonas sp.]
MIKSLVLIPIFYLLSGCAALYKPATSNIAVYDFGVQHHPSQNESQSLNQKRKSLLVTDAAAPSWLDNTAIQYRLLYHSPSQAYTYANSRWRAPPAIIMTQIIRDRIITNTGEQVVKNSSTAKTDYILHLELEEFIQAFDTMNDSHVIIGLRASLIERGSRNVLAQKDFTLKKEAPDADAAGAVLAFSSAGNQLIGELIEWLAMQLPPR